jgi:hypothetical protein
LIADGTYSEGYF